MVCLGISSWQVRTFFSGNRQHVAMAIRRTLPFHPDPWKMPWTIGELHMASFSTWICQHFIKETHLSLHRGGMLISKIALGKSKLYCRGWGNECFSPTMFPWLGNDGGSIGQRATSQVLWVMEIPGCGLWTEYLVFQQDSRWTRLLLVCFTFYKGFFVHTCTCDFPENKRNISLL